jgi:hypothetical protein
MKPALNARASENYLAISRSSSENLVERDFLIRILFQAYFDFADSK